ncbi:MAG: thioredoxin-disulfide reductase [Ruminococcaceae bacterium]|nr:thioredoxin-disulfide reductase [Oscillospiraceae bacterium]
MEKYNAIIIGAGPAGYTAAIYALRAGKTCVIIEKLVPGGQMGTTAHIENYPGYTAISGWELTEKMKEQALTLGAAEMFGEVTEVDFSDGEKRVTVDENVISGDAVIIASGARPRKLGVDREDELMGKGVSYCATCDGMFFRGKTVAVSGGGNTAFEDALYLANLCKKVYIIHRRDTFRASPANVKKAEAKENIEFITDSAVCALVGEKSLSAIEVKNLKTGETASLEVGGLFVAVGRIPETEPFRGAVEMDEAGYIIAGEDTETSVKGVFAAGDVRTKSLRQIITACADGAYAGEAVGAME